MQFQGFLPCFLGLLAIAACDNSATSNADAGLAELVDAAPGVVVDAGPSSRPACQLVMSASADRSSPMPVMGHPPSPAYIFTACTDPLPAEVVYWLSDPLSTAPTGIQESAPFDFQSAPADIPIPFYWQNYPSDTYTLSAAAKPAGESDLFYFLVGQLEIAGSGEPVWMISDFPDRRNARVLAGETITANAYIHLRPGSRERGEFDEVRMLIDSTEVQYEFDPPFDLMSGAPDGTADPFDPSLFTSGMHTIEAQVDTPDGTEIFGTTFAVP